jgi:hypothetical protein
MTQNWALLTPPLFPRVGHDDSGRRRRIAKIVSKVKGDGLRNVQLLLCLGPGPATGHWHYTGCQSSSSQQQQARRRSPRSMAALLPLLLLLSPLLLPTLSPPASVTWPPAQQCYAVDGPNRTEECRPGWDQCQWQPWGADTPQYHLRDRTCAVGDPNEPVYDPRHQLYHLFYQVGSGAFPGSPATGLWLPKGALVQGPLQGHAVSRDMVKWAHLPTALWNDQPYDSVAIYTGSATVVNGSVALIYPGVCDGSRPANGKPTNTGPVVWPSCSTDFAYHYNLVLARPASAIDPLLINWTKTLVANNTQRDPSGAWRTSDGYYQFLTWDQVLWSSKDFLSWKSLGQPGGLPVGDCPSLFQLPQAAAGAGPPPAGSAQPTHVHKISYDSRDFYSLGTYTANGPYPGIWLATPQPARLLDSTYLLHSCQAAAPCRAVLCCAAVCCALCAESL